MSTKPTKGKFRVDLVERNCSSPIIVDDGEVVALASYMSTPDEQYANADLIADAFNTYTLTGLTPSELAERVKVLEEACKKARTLIGQVHGIVHARQIQDHIPFGLKEAIIAASAHDSLGLDAALTKSAGGGK